MDSFICRWLQVDDKNWLFLVAVLILWYNWYLFVIISWSFFWPTALSSLVHEPTFWSHLFPLCHFNLSFNVICLFVFHSLLITGCITCWNQLDTFNLVSSSAGWTWKESKLKSNQNIPQQLLFFNKSNLYADEIIFYKNAFHAK